MKASHKEDPNQQPTISLEPKDVAEIVQREGNFTNQMPLICVVIKRVPADKLQNLATTTANFLCELNSQDDPLQIYASIFIYSKELEQYGLLEMMKSFS